MFTWGGGGAPWVDSGKLAPQTVETLRKLSAVDNVTADDLLFPTFRVPREVLWRSFLTSPVQFWKSHQWSAVRDARRDREAMLFDLSDVHTEGAAYAQQRNRMIQPRDPLHVVYAAFDESRGTRPPPSVMPPSYGTVLAQHGAEAATPQVDSPVAPPPLSSRLASAVLRVGDSFPLLALGVNVQYGIIYCVTLGPALLLARIAALRLAGRGPAARLAANALTMGRYRRARAAKASLPLVAPFIRLLVRSWAPLGLRLGGVFTIASWASGGAVWAAATAASDRLRAAGLPFCGAAVRAARDAVPAALYSNPGAAGGAATAVVFLRHPLLAVHSLPLRAAAAAAVAVVGAEAGALHYARLYPAGDQQVARRLRLWWGAMVRGERGAARAKLVEEEEAGLLAARPSHSVLATA